jgi:hypothetical protein
VDAHQIFVRIINFKQRFSWAEGQMSIGSARLCSNCDNELDLSKGGCQYSEDGCFIDCAACGAAHFYDNQAEWNYWDQVSAIRDALTRALREDPGLTGEKAIVVACAARDVTPHRREPDVWD